MHRGCEKMYAREIVIWFVGGFGLVKIKRKEFYGSKIIKLKKCSNFFKM
jgi:hypothetical protein